MKKKLFVFIVFFTLAIIFNFKLILSTEKTALLMIPDGTATFPINYLRIMMGTWAWNGFLSQGSWGLDFLSYRSLFWIIGLLFSMSTTQLLILERTFFSFLTFCGVFFLSEDYLSRSLKKRKGNYVLIASFIASLIYGLNPSYMIGDSFWPAIQFSFVSLPWIMWSLNKAVLDKNWKYVFLCALLISLNADEHFLWAGFPIIITLYFGFIFTVKLLKEKEIDFYSVSIFLLLILIFASLTSYRLINRLAITSSYQLSLTRAGVDVCWGHATLLNMLRAMSHMDLPNIYATTHSIFYSLNSLMPLTLLIPLFALAALLWYKKNWIILFYGALLTVSILPFFSGSPFKWLHYWLFFNTPFGAAFRTWRVPDAYIALSLSVMLAFSFYYLLKKLSNKRKYLSVFIIAGMIFISSVYSWPLLTGDANGRLTPVKVPNEYLEMYSFLSNQTGDLRVVYIPEFLYSYGTDTNLKPLWSSEFGAIQEFLTYSSPKPTFWPIGQWGHFYDFSLSPLYSSLLRTADIDALSTFLNIANIKYIVIHDDIPAIKESIRNCINLLNDSIDFKLVFQDNFVYVFENQFPEKKIDISSETVLVDGGYRAVEKLITTLNHSNTNYNYVFLDQKLQSESLEEVKTVLTDKPQEQLTKDLIFAKVIHANPNSACYPYDFVVEHEPNLKWSRASYLDPHQQVWHSYVNWENYAWDFDYGKGLAFTINSNDSMTAPLDIQTSGEYALLLRYFANEKGGEIILNIENKTLALKTLDAYDGFFWFEDYVNLDKGRKQMVIKNGNGFNAVSAISLIPKSQYEKMLKNATNYLSERRILDMDLNLIENPSFEEELNNWKMDDSVEVDKKFEIFLDDSAAFNGKYSLKVVTNYTKTEYGWSWIRSNWINVTSGEDYSLVTHIKAENVNSSSIVLEAYDKQSNKSLQLAQVPSVMYGTFDWKIYKYRFVIPENITKIRVVLNAGWTNENGISATTFFDDIKLIPLKSQYIRLNLSKIDELNAKVDNYTKINSSFHKVKVSTTQPFMLLFSESYDPLWKARVYDDGDLIETVEPIPIYGIINGFWVNQTGALEIAIEYEPQRWYYLGSTISLATLISCVIYLTYTYAKSKTYSIKQKLK